LAAPDPTEAGGTAPQPPQAPPTQERGSGRRSYADLFNNALNPAAAAPSAPAAQTEASAPGAAEEPGNATDQQPPDTRPAPPPAAPPVPGEAVDAAETSAPDSGNESDNAPESDGESVPEYVRPDTDSAVEDLHTGVFPTPELAGRDRAAVEAYAANQNDI